ncbi:MAG: hypothetical protein LBL83_08515, partial [Clostridiales bacterium]|nr:hypothetical protein [Clostridiales bacterium]
APPAGASESASAAGGGRHPVAYFGDGSPGIDLPLIAGAAATYNTDYWHYSGGYWRDGNMAESAIRDSESSFWTNPEDYAGHGGLRIAARAELPPAVAEHLAAGGGVELSVRPRMPDLVNEAYGVEYELTGGELIVYAMPKFNVAQDVSYRTYEPSLPDLVPIVREGYGWNMYAIYRGGAKLGVLESSHAPDPGRVEFSDILDREGHLRPGKSFMVRDPDTGRVTPANSGDVTIGDGSFSMLGAVGIWFAFEFDVAFYKAKAPDLSVAGISPLKAEAGKPIRIEIRVRNGSGVPLGEGGAGGAGSARLDVAIGGEKRSLAVGIGRGAEAAAIIEWTPPGEAAEVEIVAEVNPDRAIFEDNYANNALRAVLAVAKPERPPDLAVTGFRQAPSPALVSSAAKAFVTVKNLGDAACSGAALLFSGGGAAREKRVDLGGGEEKAIEFEWLAQETPGEMALWAHINPDRAIEETDYGNNRMEYAAAVGFPPADLSIASITPSRYPAGMTVVTLVEVRNGGERQFGDAAGSGGGVPVSFSIPALGIEKTETVYMDKGASAYVPFAWESPSRGARLAIAATVNAGRAIEETDYSNNALSIEAEVAADGSPAFGANTVRREWTESRLSHYERVEVIVNGEPEYVRRPVYETKRFYAEVSLSASLSPGSMKSGYGVECEVVASLSTNYDKPSGVAGIQSVHAYLPSSGYSEAIELELAPGSENRWRFPANPASVSGGRVQYVPVEWPDGTAFRIGFTGRGAQCPGGAMAASAYAETRISGSMFEDDVTSSAR